MTQMFANMDNNTIKQMMQMQGMSISDEQINMMKNPEMIKSVQGMIKSNPDIVNKRQQEFLSDKKISSQINSNDTVSSNTNPPSQMPNMSQLGGMDMKSMMDFVQKNPELLKSLSPQLANMMGSKGMENMDMGKAIETIVWIMSIPSKIKSFFTSTQGIVITSLVGYIVYNYFWGK